MAYIKNLGIYFEMKTEGYRSTKYLEWGCSDMFRVYQELYVWGIKACQFACSDVLIVYPCSVAKESSQGPKVDAMQTQNLPFKNIIFLSE